VTCEARLSAPLTHLSGGGLTLCRGGDPDVGATVCERFAIYNLGCGRLGRAASSLEGKRSYVGTASRKVALEAC
jgi:hypothetical protein